MHDYLYKGVDLCYENSLGVEMKSFSCGSRRILNTHELKRGQALNKLE